MEIKMSNEVQDSPTADSKSTITLNDIAAVVQILNVCTTRAVWKSQELSSVGQLYDRLVAFLEGAGVTMEPAVNPEEKDQQ